MNRNRVYKTKKDCEPEQGKRAKVGTCGDCIYYDWKEHKCGRGAHEVGKPHDAFYQDCSLGLYEEKEEEMSELIDKQEALKKLWELHGSVDLDGMAIIREAIKLIESLPSVKKEPNVFTEKYMKKLLIALNAEQK